MSEDRTEIVRLPATDVGAEGEALRLTFEAPDGRARSVRTRDRLTLGAHADCDLVFPERGVSKRHAEVFRRDGTWWVRDLGSTNGTWLNSEKLEGEAELPDNAVLRLIPKGAPITCTVTHADEPTGVLRDLEEQVSPSVTGIFRTLFDPAAAPEAVPGSQEDLTVKKIRQAASQARALSLRKYRVALVAVAAVAVLAVAGVVLQQRRLARLNDLAVEIFYDMKQLELRLAASGGAEPESRAELDAMAERYDRMLEELGVIDASMSPEERLILRMARVFGECELEMPDGFVDTTLDYVADWQGSERLAEALERLDAAGGAATVVEQLVEHEMAPQFLYLGLQESDFRLDAVGPKTRFGIAKGPWQFIPATASALGLRTGPLVEVRSFDPRDERFDFELSTDAAARYLRDLYLTDAQSSGLLVAASYNWGQGNLRRLLRTMPENPRERNFWALLEEHDIPQETRDYVFKIFSAAVVGEDPALFGFSFENPLAGELGP